MSFYDNRHWFMKWLGAARNHIGYSIRLTGAYFLQHTDSGGISVLHDYYHQTSNISCTLVGDKIVDHSDVVGASPVVAAPTTYSFAT